MMVKKKEKRGTVDTGVVGAEKLPVDYLGLRHWRWLARQAKRKLLRLMLLQIFIKPKTAKTTALSF